jgi:hypothetical protein
VDEFEDYFSKPRSPQTQAAPSSAAPPASRSSDFDFEDYFSRRVPMLPPSTQGAAPPERKVLHYGSVLPITTYEGGSEFDPVNSGLTAPILRGMKFTRDVYRGEADPYTSQDEVANMALLGLRPNPFTRSREGAVQSAANARAVPQEAGFFKTTTKVAPTEAELRTAGIWNPLNTAAADASAASAGTPVPRGRLRSAVGAVGDEIGQGGLATRVTTGLLAHSLGLGEVGSTAVGLATPAIGRAVSRMAGSGTVGPDAAAAVAARQGSPLMGQQWRQMQYDLTPQPSAREKILTEMGRQYLIRQQQQPPQQPTAGGEFQRRPAAEDFI